MTLENSKRNIVILVAVSFLLSIGFYAFLPGYMVTHWGLNDEPNGTMTRFWGSFFLPLLLVFLASVLYYSPKYYPLRDKYGQFEGVYLKFILALLVFMDMMHLDVLLWNVGFEISPTKILIGSLAVLFYLLGGFLPKIERNFLIGIRTPWTLSSDEVWHETHRVGGTLFKVVGVVTLFGYFFEKYQFYFVFVPVILGSVFLTLFSAILAATKDHHENL